MGAAMGWLGTKGRRLGKLDQDRQGDRRRTEASRTYPTKSEV